MLTKRQKEILDFIEKFIKEHDYAPLLKEIRKHFHLNSVATIHEHIVGLREKGYLRKDDNQPRAIEPNDRRNGIVEIPLLGYIAAGEPIEAIESPETLEVQETMLAKSGKHFALKVKGDSMVNEGIFDGDTVIVREQTTAEDGETVVAIIDRENATLKKLYREKGSIRLQPANSLLLPIFVDPNEFEVRGKVISIIHKFEEEKSFGKKGLERRNDFSWDYRNANTKPYTHIFHQYPAMFIPQVARRLVQSYSKEDDVICDIFCGSGTALVESRLLGRNCWGIDLNPHAIFLAKAKTTPLDPSRLQKIYFELLKESRQTKLEPQDTPAFFNVDYWFKPDVIKDLAKLRKTISNINGADVRNFFLVSFSHTVRTASNTRGGEFKLFRIPEEKLENYEPDVLSIFKKKAEENINGMREYYRDVKGNTWVEVIEGDSTKENGIPEESVDLIITSPPYGDSRTTVAYGQFSRLSSQWLGLVTDDRLQIDNEMLGGKPVKSLENNLRSENLSDIVEKISNRDKKRAAEVLSFFIDLEKTMEQAHRMLKDGKYFCLVIGNRTVKDVRIPTDFIITEIGEELGFVSRDIFVRNIPNKRMPKKNSPTNIAGKLSETMNTESIVILQKVK